MHPNCPPYAVGPCVLGGVTAHLHPQFQTRLNAQQRGHDPFPTRWGEGQGSRSPPFGRRTAFVPTWGCSATKTQDPRGALGQPEPTPVTWGVQADAKGEGAQCNPGAGILGEGFTGRRGGGGWEKGARIETGSGGQREGREGRRSSGVFLSGANNRRPAARKEKLGLLGATQETERAASDQGHGVTAPPTPPLPLPSP